MSGMLPWSSGNRASAEGVALGEEGDSRVDARTLRPLLRDCAAGFYQEMFFLGKDILHGRGNQLVEFGFVRTPSKGLKGTSCYTLEAKSGAIDLYGSCASFYSASSSVAFIRPRSRFYHWLPEKRCVAGLWTDRDLGSGAPERLFENAKPLLRWWLEYERWIADRFGDAYRDACFDEWRTVNKQKSWLSPREARQWLEQLLASGNSPMRPKKLKSSD
ncbi:MAG: hypothetical protein AAGK09_02490 [Planctomycetota bacterium]